MRFLYQEIIVVNEKGRSRRWIWGYLWLLGLPLAVVNLWLNPHAPPFERPLHEFSFITPAGLKILQSEGDLLLLDARTLESYAIDHIAGALSLYPGYFDDALIAVIDAWRPAYTIVIYCDDAECGSSVVLARRLRDELEWDSIYLLEGGWAAWQKELQQ